MSWTPPYLLLVRRHSSPPGAGGLRVLVHSAAGLRAHLLLPEEEGVLRRLRRGERAIALRAVHAETRYSKWSAKNALRTEI